jgi:heptosyltransferase-2
MTMISSVAVIQTAFVGDVLLTMPLMKALRIALPDVVLSLVTTPAGADVISGVDFIDRVHAFDKRGDHRSTSGMRSLAQQLGPVDALIVPHKSIRTLRLVRMIRAPFVVTYTDAWTRFAATVKVPYPIDRHDADRHFALLQGLLPSTAWCKEQLVPITLSDADDVAIAREHVRDLGTYVVLAPGSAWPTKQWPLDSMQELASTIVFGGRRVVVVGDASVNGRLAGPGIMDLAGALTMRQSAAVIAGAEALVSNDSAPLHIASLQNVPAVAIFGPTTPAFGFGPFSDRHAVVERDLACRPCSPHGTVACPIGTHACMNGIGADAVMQALRTVLQPS